MAFAVHRHEPPAIEVRAHETSPLTEPTPLTLTVTVQECTPQVHFGFHV